MYCQCKPLVATMVRARLWPATAQRLHLAFTFELLDWAEALVLECQVALKDLCKALCFKCPHLVNKVWMHIYDGVSIWKPSVTYHRGKTTTHRWLMRLRSIGMRKHYYNKDAQKLYTVGKIVLVLPPCLTQVYKSGVETSCVCLSWPWLW